MARGNQADAKAGHEAGTERRPTMAQQTFTIGAVVLNLEFTPAVVVGHYMGEPMLQSVRQDGTTFGGKWVGNPDKCQAMATVADAYRAALANAAR